MGESVRVRIVVESALRCPYCHDCAGEAGEGDDALVECAGCGTKHHVECIAELGRCTVIGCERPLVASGPRVGVERAESRIQRRIRARIRERVSGFVERNCRAPVEEAPDRAREELEHALEAVRQAEVADDPVRQRAALARAIGLEALLGGGQDRSEVPGWLPLEEARALLAELEADDARRPGRSPLARFTSRRLGRENAAAVVLLAVIVACVIAAALYLAG